MNAQDALIHHPLLPDTVVLELQIKPLRPEQLRQFLGIPFGVVVLTVPQPPGNLSGQASTQGNEAAAVLTQQLQVDSGLDVKALRPPDGDQVGKVPIPLLILAQQYQMTALGIELMDLVEPGPALGCDVDLTADDGLDPRRLAGPVEIDDAVHDAVIRDGAGGLAHALDDLRQVLDAAGAVQEAKLRMHM